MATDNLIPRRVEHRISYALGFQPAVELVGPRHSGKSSLARKVAATRPSVYYDLENRADLAALENPGAELRKHSDKLVVLDEIQHKPEICRELRVIIDELRFAGRRAGKFLLVSSVDGRLQRQSQSLAGRISSVRLHPLDLLEVAGRKSMETVWQRGGQPESLFAASDRESCQQRLNNLVATVRQDAMQARSRVNPEQYLDLLEQIAGCQGRVLNKSRLAALLRVSAPTLETMLVTLEEMMLIRRVSAHVQPIELRKVRNPKYYICDSGIFALLLERGVQAGRLDAPDAQARRAASWEGFVIENLAAARPDMWWQLSFFKAHSGGSAIDLLISPSLYDSWAIDISAAANLNLRREFRKGIEILAPQRSFIVYGGEFKHRSYGNTEIVSLADMMNELLAQDRYGRLEPSAIEKIVDPDPSFNALIEALRQPSAPLVNLCRADFLDNFAGRFETMLAANPLLHDSDARSLWRQRRGELIEWLAMESKVTPGQYQSGQEEIWVAKLVETLENVVNARPEDGLQKSAPDACGTFGQLCCYDLFVHVLAVLMRAKCFSLLHRLIAEKYYVHGNMRERICFWSRQPANQAGLVSSPQASVETVEDFVAESPSLPVAQLIEAELLLLVGGIVTKQEQPPTGQTAKSRLVDWLPWIALGRRPMPKLPFFVRAQQRRGAQQLATCLGLAADAGGMKQAKETIQAVLADIQRVQIKEENWHGIMRALNVQGWHDLD